MCNSLQHSIGYFRGNQLDRTDSVVVGRDHVINWIGVTVGVHNSDDGNIQPVGLFHCGGLPSHIHDEEQIGEVAHLFDTPQPVVEFHDLALQAQRLFFRQTLKVAPVTAGFQIEQVVNALSDGEPVGQCAAQPALVDIGHSAAL